MEKAGSVVAVRVGDPYVVWGQGEGWRVEGNVLVPSPVDGAMRVIVIGTAGQGKTELVTTLLSNATAWASIFRRVWIVSPTGDVDHYQRLGLPRERYLEPTDAAVLQKIAEWLEWRDKGEEPDAKACFVFDDMTGTDIPKGRAIPLLCNTMRKKGLSVIWIANRVYQSVPPVLRDQATCIIAFQGNKGLANALSEQFTPINWTPTMFRRVYYIATKDGRGNFLAILPTIPNPLLRFIHNFSVALTYNS
jgi:hypothetical protein